jgi:hypothetical protein
MSTMLKQILAGIFLITLSGCYVQPNVESTNIKLVKKPYVNVLQNKSKFVCDTSNYPAVRNMVNSYLRSAQSPLGIAFSLAEYNKAREHDYSLVKRFVSKEYIANHYIMDNSAVIADAPASVRSPELVCIKQIRMNKYQAFIFEYNRKSNAHSSVDVMGVVKNSERLEFEPYGEPESASEDYAQWAMQLGASSWPRTYLNLTNRIYKESE